MKLIRLELRAFGSLTDAKLDFGEPRPVLHVIYGANEAGKSTALRAIHDLFYGIPENTGDAHRHKAPDLRIAALVRDARERELYVVRRKGRKDTLLDAAGAPLPGAETSWLTAGVAEPHFEAFFGLSYAELSHDAKQLLSGSGDLGESLFGAGLGGRSVRAVLDGLDAEAEAIYRPRGKTQKLNEAIVQLDTAKRDLRESAVDAQKFDAQRLQITVAQADARALRERGTQLNAERLRLERTRRVLPLLGKRVQLLRERAALGELRLLDVDAAQARARAEETLRIEGSKIAQLDAELARLNDERTALDIPEALVALDEGTIDELRDRIGSYKRTRTGLYAQREALARARAALDQEQLGDAEQVDDALERRVREHALLHGALVREVENRERELARKRSELEAQRKQHAELVTAHATRRGSASATRTPLFARLAIPARASVEVFVERLAAIEREHEAHDNTARGLAVEAERIARELEAMSLGSVVPTESDLVSVRAQRAAAWQRLREQVAHPNASDAAALQQTSAQVDELIERSDELADRLRREAERVAQHARLLAERGSCERSLARVSQEGLAIEQLRAAARAEWLASWKDSGIEPSSPREMRTLVDEHEARVQRIDQLELELASHSVDLEAQRAALEKWQTSWSELAGKLGLAPSASVADAETRLSALAARRARRVEAQKLERQLLDAERELATFESDVAQRVLLHLPEQRGQPADVAAAAFVSRYQRAREHLLRRAAIEGHIRAGSGDRETARLRQRAAEQRLQELLQAAGEMDLNALRAAEERSTSGRRLDAQLEQVSAELDAAADGVSIAALEAEAAGASVDLVRARLAEIEGELEEQDEQIRAAAHTLASLQAGAERWERGGGAIEASSRVAEHVTTIRALGERYVQLRLAAATLRREVVRYREQHKGPILRSASEIFARLTLGAWRGLETSYDADDEPVLECVRDDGEHIKVSGLSAGTRDQLYLALRLASLRELAESQELMPLVLDDILVHFDDERARAALRVLGELAQVTQILFFTHHARLCELAREALPAENLELHELPQPRQRARTVA